MTRMASFVLTVAVAVCAVLLSGVHAHGSLRKPVARQFCHPDGINGVQEEAGNGARGRTEAAGDKNGGMPSFCGDPFEGTDSSDRGDPEYIKHPCPSQATYQQGGTVDLEVAVKFDHGGSWEVAVCCDGTVTQECLDNSKLLDTQFGEEMWYLQENAPVDPNDRDFQIYKQSWTLPADVSGEKCLLVWTWWTGHRCVFWPCEERVCGYYSQGKSPLSKPRMLEPERAGWKMPVCKRYPEPGEYPQIFRNCADITIKPGAGGAGGDTAANPPATTTGTASPPEDPETEPEEENSMQHDDSIVESTFDEDDEEEKMPSNLNEWMKSFMG